jgi:hypothetical protein
MDIAQDFAPPSDRDHKKSILPARANLEGQRRALFATQLLGTGSSSVTKSRGVAFFAKDTRCVSPRLKDIPPIGPTFPGPSQRSHH